MGIEEVFIDPCPGCEDVVPGIVTPGGPPSPPLTRRWGGIKKKSSYTNKNEVFGAYGIKLQFYRI